MVELFHHTKERIEIDKMKVLLITGPINNTRDHAGKNLLLDLVKNIPDKELHILTSEKISSLKDNIVQEKIYSQDSFFSLKQKIRLFRRLLKKDDIDVYHFLFHPSPLTAKIASIILNLKNKKSIQTTVNLIEDKNLKKCLFGDKIIVQTDLMLKKIKDSIKINPGIDLDKFKPKTKSETLLRTLGIKNNFVVLYAVDYRKGRNLKNTLENIKMLIQKYPEIKFIFACRLFKKREKQTKNKLIYLASRLNIKNNLVLLDTVKDMPSLINISDIIIYPIKTTTEKMMPPLILLEALAMEKAIITTDIEPLNELYKKDIGIKINQNDPLALSGAIELLYKNKNLRAKMGKNGRNLVREFFDIKKTAKKYSKIYET